LLCVFLQVSLFGLDDLRFQRLLEATHGCLARQQTLATPPS
jgi:hypothetical protein